MPTAYEETLSHIKAMRQRFEAREKDRKMTEDLLHMAFKGYSSKIPRMPAEPKTKDKRVVAPDILGFLLRSFSYLYRTEPVRTPLAEDEASQVFLRDKLWGYDDGLTSALALADQLVRVSGAVLLGLTWTPAPDGRDESKTPDSDGYRAEVITSDCFEVFGGLDPRYPDAVIAKMGCGWVYWDRVYRVALSDRWEPMQSVLADGSKTIYYEHGLGVLPFVVVQNVARWHKTCAPRMGGDDLYRAILNLGSMLREFGWTVVLQRGQPWMSGDKKESILLAPDAVVNVSAGGSFGIAANAANLSGMSEAIRGILVNFATCLGLPSRTFKTEVNAAVSGVAILLDHQELEADRQQRVTIFRGVEERCALTAAAQHAAQFKVALDGRMRVGFRQPDPIITFDERLKRVTFLQDRGLIAPEDVLAELYPAATPEEISARLERAATARELAQDSGEAAVDSEVG
jgi:hypothetical protein